MQDFAYPLPAMVIAEMLGVPTSDRDLLKAWSQKMATFFSLTKKGDPAVIESMAQTLLELTDYLREIVRQRRQVPQDDMISNLLAADEEGNILTEEELLSNCVLMLFAGHETTMNLIGNGLLALQRHPEQYEKLKRNPALGAMAVEELLRYDSPVQFLARVAMADLAFGGKQIRAGERITFALGAANRDPAQFSAPDKLELSRQKNKHLTFGYGTHFCLGASLARLEAEIAFNTLLRRLPRLQLATETVTWRSGFQLRGLTSLPVTFKN
jgi:cytochrome P450